MSVSLLSDIISVSELAIGMIVDVMSPDLKRVDGYVLELPF